MRDIESPAGPAAVPSGPAEAPAGSEDEGESGRRHRRSILKSWPVIIGSTISVLIAIAAAIVLVFYVGPGQVGKW